MIEDWKLKQRQALPLDVKISLTKKRIKEFYDYYDGDVYVGFSGGKDSTVMLHLVRSLYPEVKAVFVDTGLEYPEIRDFVKSFDNIEIIRPKMSFKQVIDKYGYPVISKNVSMAINRYRNTKDPLQKEYRMFGTKNDKFIGKSGVIPKKWRFLINAPFKIGEQCCDVMKKQPFKRFEKETGLKPYIGLMASDSNLRKLYYLKSGCNAFESNSPKSLPLGFWLESDIWDYIKKENISYCKVYDTGITRTGCMFCMFGLQKDDPNNTRFDIMKITHSKYYDYCMDKLGLRKVINFVNNKGVIITS